MLHSMKSSIKFTPEIMKKKTIKIPWLGFFFFFFMPRSYANLSGHRGKN